MGLRSLAIMYSFTIRPQCFKHKCQRESKNPSQNMRFASSNRTDNRLLHIMMKARKSLWILAPESRAFVTKLFIAQWSKWGLHPQKMIKAPEVRNERKRYYSAGVPVEAGVSVLLHFTAGKKSKKQYWFAAVVESQRWLGLNIRSSYLRLGWAD